MAAQIKARIAERYQRHESSSMDMGGPGAKEEGPREGELIGDEENTRHIRYREHWNAKQPITELKPMTKPVHNVIITYTKSYPCDGVEECDKAVRELQNHYQEKGLPDIPYSFLITRDGNVYEARGWDYRPFVPKKSFPRLRGSRIVIAQINTEFDDQLIPPADIALWELLQFGIHNEFIHAEAKKITSGPWIS